MRPGLLSLVMLGLLLASVAGAWWLVQVRGAPQRRGEKILEEIRAQRLTSFWGDQAQTLWYLGRGPNGTPVAWHATFRSPIQNGYVGIGRASRPGLVARSNWVISADALRGECHASYGLPPLGSPEAREVLIAIGDGRVTVQDHTPDKKEGDTSAMPANYIPEDLLDLVIQAVARKGQIATFTTVADNLPLRGGQVWFTRLRMSPRGPDTVLVEALYPDGSVTLVYDLKGGQIVSYKSLQSQITYERVDGKAINTAAANEFRQNIRQLMESEPPPAPAEDQDQAENVRV